MTRPPPGALRRVADPEEVAREAAQHVVASAAQAIRARGSFTLVLAGGSTPRRLYELLADDRGPFRARVAWERVHAFFGDERHVPPDHPDSNYGMAREALLDRVALASVHRMRGEEPDAEAAAASYEAELGGFFGLAPGRDEPPRFDLTLLGVGADAHTASLFPGSAAVEERRRWVVAPYVEQVNAHRITLTLPVLNRSREVLFLAAGASKAEAIGRVFSEEATAPAPPSGRVQPDGTLLWIVDRAAAARLPAARPE